MARTENPTRDAQEYLTLARAAINELPKCRERSLALTKLDETELWLDRVKTPQLDVQDE